ncbi:MAG TPA: hypothetical protein VIH54_04760, partial [Chthoniobacterales bacterium]
ADSPLTGAVPGKAMPPPLDSFLRSAFLDRVTIVFVGEHSKEVFHHTYTAAVLENLHRIARVLTP